MHSLISRSARIAVLAIAPLLAAAPAVAQTTPPTSVPADQRLAAVAGTNGLPTFAQMQESLAKYQGTTAAFSQSYATNAAQPIGTWLSSNAASLAVALEIPILGTAQPQLTSTVQLQDFLASSGFATAAKGWGSYSQDVLRDPLAAPIVTRSMDFASAFSSLRMPDISSATSSLTTAGLFSERAITTLATDYPDIIAQVQAGGQLSPPALAAWKVSMKQAATAALPNVADGLIDPCQASLLWAMGSGSAAGARSIGGNSCGTCIAQGLYMHSGFSNMLNTNTRSSVIPPADFNQIPSWRRDAIVGSNPAVVSTPNFTSQGSGCSSSPQAASTVISGAVANLGK